MRYEAEEVTSDQSAQLRQLREGHNALRVTLESVRVSGTADPVKIRLAENLLEKVEKYAKEAIGG